MWWGKQLYTCQQFPSWKDEIFILFFWKSAKATTAIAQNLSTTHMYDQLAWSALHNIEHTWVVIQYNHKNKTRIPDTNEFFLSSFLNNFNTIGMTEVFEIL